MATVRQPGWDDSSVLALLSLFRKHLLYYVYASDAEFAEVVRAELPDKSSAQILDSVRALMMQFGIVLSTKNFRTDVIMTNGSEVYVYEHMYESISQLQENRAGGVWLPDELSRFLQKAKQYRELFLRLPEVYFQRIQFWGKSVAETKNKFYALRDLYVRDKRRSRLCDERTRVEVTRLELLTEIFAQVPPPRREEKIVGAPSKAPKLWSSEEMETLVDYLVRITNEIQSNGSSDLVNQVAETLHRTEQSCVNKLADMRDKFLKKSTTVRAANLPDIVFDRTSDAHKVFSADWSDNNDPYAFGYFAIKARCQRLLSERNKKRRGKSIWLPRPKLRSTTAAARKVSAGIPTRTVASAAAANPASRSSRPSNLQNEGGASGRGTSGTLPANDYAPFVREVAEECQWTEKVVLNVLRCMQHSIELYRTNKLVDFFTQIASLTPGVTFQDLFVDGHYILTEFEKRFGTLDGFENVSLMVSDVNSHVETKRQDHGIDSEASTGSASTQVLDTAVVATDEQEMKQQDRTIEAGASYTADDPPLNALSENAIEHADSNRVAADEDTGGSPGQDSPPRSSKQTPLTGNEDAAMEGDHCDHDQSPLLGSPVQTPQTGNEDAADEHSSSTAGKQSSPEDAWDEGADVGADLDDDGLDNQSVGSSDNAWSGSSNIYDMKDSHHSCLNTPYPSGSSKKPSKRGKDEQYGKSFNLAKKRRLDENKVPADNDDEDGEDEGYDEGEDDDDGDEDDDELSEDGDDEVPDDIDGTNSDGEQGEPPHPLQSILDSLDSHMAELQDKQRRLIERKEEREWCENQYATSEYRGIHLGIQQFASKR